MHKLIRCPNCGAVLNVDTDYNIYYCENCGTDIEVDYAEEVNDES